MSLFTQLVTGTENIRDYRTKDVHRDNYSLFQRGVGMLLLKTLLQTQAAEKGERRSGILRRISPVKGRERIIYVALWGWSAQATKHAVLAN
jgi:hypothetical protein